MKFSKEEKEVIKMFFTETDKDIFALVNLPEVIKGTLFSRYSRTNKNIRRLFLDEFYNADELKSNWTETKAQIGVNTKKAEDFYERILVGYGDDSVAELGGVHVALENISMLATKSVEEHRMGISPLEKSTRYVYYDTKIDGEYLYYHDPKILKSPFASEYIRVCNLLFDTYSKIVREIQPTLKQIYPGDENDTAYKFSIRAKACDVARNLLPLSTLTNMGIYANGRTYEYIILRLLNSNISEVKTMGNSLYDQVGKVIPAFIKRAKNERGDKYRSYLKTNALNIRNNIPKSFGKNVNKASKSSQVTLIDYDKDAIDKIISMVLIENSELSAKDISSYVKKMSVKEKEKLINSLADGRENRHHKPGRATEAAYFTFEVVADWGVYKDLMRHRVLSRYKQLFTTELGYETPYEITTCGFAEDYHKAMQEADTLYKKLKKDFPEEAQYLVTHGSLNRFIMKLNLREVVHMCELRATPQGHPTYRKVAQDMTNLVLAKFPIFKNLLQFVDFNNYELERMSAFKKISDKAKKLGVTVFKD